MNSAAKRQHQAWLQPWKLKMESMFQKFYSSLKPQHVNFQSDNEYEWTVSNMKLFCLLWDDPITSEAQHTHLMSSLHHAGSLYRKGFKWMNLCWLPKTWQQHLRELSTAHPALSDPIFTVFFKSSILEKAAAASQQVWSQASPAKGSPCATHFSSKTFGNRQIVCLPSCYALYLHTYPPENKDGKTFYY